MKIMRLFAILLVVCCTIMNVASRRIPEKTDRNLLLPRKHATGLRNKGRKTNKQGNDNKVQDLHAEEKFFEITQNWLGTDGDTPVDSYVKTSVKNPMEMEFQGLHNLGWNITGYSNENHGGNFSEKLSGNFQMKALHNEEATTRPPSTTPPPPRPTTRQTPAKTPVESPAETSLEFEAVHKIGGMINGNSGGNYSENIDGNFLIKALKNNWESTWQTTRRTPRQTTSQWQTTWNPSTWQTERRTTERQTTERQTTEKPKLVHFVGKFNGDLVGDFKEDVETTRPWWDYSTTSRWWDTTTERWQDTTTGRWTWDSSTRRWRYTTTMQYWDSTTRRWRYTTTRRWDTSRPTESPTVVFEVLGGNIEGIVNGK